METKVEIEFCGGCGYLPRFEELEKAIKEAVPTAEVTGKEGRIGSFEVYVNGQQIYSKLSTMAFPEFDLVCSIVKDASEGKEIKPIESKGWCVII